MTVLHQRSRPPATAAARRTAALVGVLPTVVGILVITLGPRWMVADGLSMVTDLLARAGAPMDPDRVESLANLVMFVPLGSLMGLAVLPRAWPVVLVVGVLLSAGVEVAQSRIPGRVPDLHDVATNAAGDLIGLLLAILVVGVARLSAVLRLRGHRPRARRNGHPGRAVVAVVVVLAAVTAGVIAVQPHLAGARAAPGRAPTMPTDQAVRGGPLTAADGFIAGGQGISPFADDRPAIAKLRPALRTALQRAARAANDDGVEVVVTSGWRSAAYQQQLLDDAVAQHGSREAASRWVSTPQTSQHVRGAAVDIGSTDAEAWFLRNGARYGLCRIYANEPWHFELAVRPGGTCPAQLQDASAR